MSIKLLIDNYCVCVAGLGVQKVGSSKKSLATNGIF
jgi:hypothetical protein